MARIGIVTDSTADMPPGVAERYGVAVVPLVVNWDGQTYRDKVDIATGDFYRRLRTSRTSPTTGAPSPGNFEAAYRAALQANDVVLSIHISSKLSGTLGVAQSVAASVAPDRILTVDSGSVSLPIGWLVESAGQMAAAGQEPGAIVRTLEEMARRLHVYAALDTLEYLRRGGRIGRAAAFAGTLLNVKPIIAIRDGEVHPVERVRTSAGALRRLVEIVVALGRVERLGMMHADAPEAAADVRRQLEARSPGVGIDEGELTSVVGTHSGPGTVGVAVLLAR